MPATLVLFVSYRPILIYVRGVSLSVQNPLHFSPEPKHTKQEKQTKTSHGAYSGHEGGSDFVLFFYYVGDFCFLVEGLQQWS